jgi:hypothetical protein
VVFVLTNLQLLIIRWRLSLRSSKVYDSIGYEHDNGTHRLGGSKWQFIRKTFSAYHFNIRNTASLINNQCLIRELRLTLRSAQKNRSAGYATPIRRCLLSRRHHHSSFHHRNTTDAVAFSSSFNCGRLNAMVMQLIEIDTKLPPHSTNIATQW